MSKDLKHTIYSPSDCLSEKMLFDYIDNKLNHKERHLVEKHLLDCEMCSDALEGLDQTTDRNKITLIKDAIAKRVLESIEKEAVVIKFNYKMAFSIAASIALLVAGVFFFNKINLKKAATNDLAELKQTDSPATLPPPPPTPATEEEKETLTNETTASGTGTAASSTKSVTFSAPLTIADQEVTLSEGQSKPEDGYYKNSSGDGENRNKQVPAENAANGTLSVSDAASTSDDRKDNNLETVSIPKTGIVERDKDAKLDDGKKAEEKPAGVAGGTGTYTWSTPTPDQSKNQKIVTKAAEDKANGEQTELAKKADIGGKYRLETKEKEKKEPAKIAGKEEKARGNKDEDSGNIKVSGEVAYEPQSVMQQNDELKSEVTLNNNTSTTIADSISAEPIYSYVEQTPEYPGGQPEMNKFLLQNFDYSKKVDSNTVLPSTKIYVQFIVGMDGAIRNPRIIKGSTPELDKEALRVIKLMPKWKPGKQNGKPVSVYYNLPIQLEIK